MNEQLQQYARQNIKEGLNKCTEKQRYFFKRMYSHDDLESAMDDVVKGISVEQLDWAMQQVKRTVDQNKKEGE